MLILITCSIMIKVLSHKYIFFQTVQSNSQKNIRFHKWRKFSLNEMFWYFQKRNFIACGRSLIGWLVNPLQGKTLSLSAMILWPPLVCARLYMCAAALIPSPLQHQSSTPTSSIMMHERHHVGKIKRLIFGSLLSYFITSHKPERSTWRWWLHGLRSQCWQTPRQREYSMNIVWKPPRIA